MKVRDIFNRSATKHGIDRDQDLSNLLPGGSALGSADLQFWPGDLGALPTGVAPTGGPVGAYKRDGRVWLFGAVRATGTVLASLTEPILPLPPEFVPADGGPAAPLFGTGGWSDGPESNNSLGTNLLDQTSNARAFFALGVYSGDDETAVGASINIAQDITGLAGFNGAHLYVIYLTGLSYVAGAA